MNESFTKRFSWQLLAILLLVSVVGGLFLSGVFATKTIVHDSLVTITYTDDGYEPKQVFITKGTTVRFVNESSIDFWPASNTHPAHDLLPEFDSEESLPPGSAWEFTFESVGPWHFHDHLQAHNLGVVYVLDENSLSVQDVCSDIEVEYENTCLYDYLYKIVELDGPAAAMQAVKDFHSKNELPVACHKATHDIGHITYALQGTEFAFTEILILCTAGFFHGIMEGLISDNNDLTAAVAWCGEVTAFYKDVYKDIEARCAHGVGHGIGESMLATFDHDWQRFKEVTEEAAERCGIYSEVELHRVVCESGVYSVVISWIMTTEQEEHYFNLEAPFAFCATLKSNSMIQECVWEFSQRLYLYHDNYDSLFNNLAQYLHVSDLHTDYAEWAARAASHRLPAVGDNDHLISLCRVADAAIEKGCLIGTIEGFITDGIWGKEQPRIETYCKNDQFSAVEQAWCLGEMDRLMGELR